MAERPQHLLLGHSASSQQDLAESGAFRLSPAGTTQVLLLGQGILELRLGQPGLLLKQRPQRARRHRSRRHDGMLAALTGSVLPLLRRQHESCPELLAVPAAPSAPLPSDLSALAIMPSLLVSPEAPQVVAAQVAARRLAEVRRSSSSSERRHCPAPASSRPASASPAVARQDQSQPPRGAATVQRYAARPARAHYRRQYG